MTDILAEYNEVFIGGIIVAVPKAEDAKNISDILRRSGLDVSVVCSTGAAVLSAVNRFEHSVVICTKRLSDMYYTDINEYLPKYCDMLLIASQTTIANSPVGIMTLSLPFKSVDLCGTVEMMLSNQCRQLKKIKEKPAKRSEADNNYIKNAKLILMDKNNMTEQEAFRYIQKCSMDSGTNMVEMAQMIISVRYEQI